MFWIVSVNDISGDLFYTYNYYEILDVHPKATPIYNPITKHYYYPQTKHLVIKAIITESESDFMNYYSKVKKL